MEGLLIRVVREGAGLAERPYIFKTLYFPVDRVRAGASVRVSISVPNGASPRWPSPFLAYVRSLPSRDLRLAIGDPFLEDLEKLAETEGRSFSNTCLRLLARRFASLNDDPASHQDDGQLQLPLLGDRQASDPGREPSRDVGLTFRESRRQRVHGWYPYVEGFSATYVRDALLRWGTRPKLVYDPFGGAGTTQLAAACLGIPSYYSEINPFMRFVAETKVNAAAWARHNRDTVDAIANRFLKDLQSPNRVRMAANVDLSPYNESFPDRDFFEEEHLRDLLASKKRAIQLTEGFPQVRALLLLACAANTVASSNMTRRADLRRRRSDEYKTRIVNVPWLVTETVQRMLADIADLPERMAPTSQASEDSRDIPHEFDLAFDLAITSPPYLNGTNYFRNTKLELWLLDFMSSEEELGPLHAKAIAAGINGITRARPLLHTSEAVEQLAVELDGCSPDRRIPQLIRHYFSDMTVVLSGVHRVLAPHGRFVLDIGDSKFYGVHVPTHRIIENLARQVGFRVEGHQTLARRHSRDKSDLVQVELIFRKSRSKGSPPRTSSWTGRSLQERISDFGRHLPYKGEPYSSRNWGHKLHSLCSYQGKLKPSLAHWLVNEFVPPGHRVLDPLGGVGTIAFEAALSGRLAVSNDLSPLASTVASAKLNRLPFSMFSMETARMPYRGHRTQSRPSTRQARSSIEACERSSYSASRVRSGQDFLPHFGPVCRCGETFGNSLSSSQSASTPSLPHLRSWGCASIAPIGFAFGSAGGRRVTSTIRAWVSSSASRPKAFSATKSSLERALSFYSLTGYWSCTLGQGAVMTWPLP